MRYFLFAILFLFSFGLKAQNDLLAKNYFEQGEYEKALVLYKKLVHYTPSPFRRGEDLPAAGRGEVLLTLKCGNSLFHTILI